MDSIRYKDEQLGWTFDCSNCYSTDFERPAGMEHLSFYEGHFICSDCGKQVSYHDEDFIKIPEWIGDFGFNENQCCVYGEIQAFVYETKKISVYGGISRSRNGWTWGSQMDTKFTYIGAGGHAYGCFSDSNNVADSREHAEVCLLQDIIKELNGYMNNKYGEGVPPEAVREYTKACKAAENQLKSLSEYKPPAGTQLSLF